MRRNFRASLLWRERDSFIFVHRVLIVLNVSKIKKRTRYTCTRIIIAIFPKNIFPWINTFWPVPCGWNGNFYFGGIRDEKWRKSALYGGGKRWERADSGTRELLFRGFDPSVNFQAGARWGDRPMERNRERERETPLPLPVEGTP